MTAQYRAVSNIRCNLGRGPVDNNCNHNSRQGYNQRRAPVDTAIRYPRITIPSWIVYNASPSELNETYTWRLAFSLEYPVGGTIYPVTWNGSPNVTVAPGALAFTSDIVPVIIAPGDPYIIRDYGLALDLRPPQATVTIVGGALASTAITDAGTGLNTLSPVFGSASAPALTAPVPVSAGAGIGGALSPTVVAGRLTALGFTPGSGYTDGTYAVVFANGANMARSTTRATGDGAQHGYNLPDLTGTPGTLAQDQLGQAGPMLIAGEVVNATSPAIGLVMDSILEGTSDQQDLNTGHTGAFEKSINNQHGWLSAGCSGETLAAYLARHSAQDLLLSGVTHLVCGLGRNDIGAGAPAIKSRMQNVWAPYLAAGIKVYQVTLLPTTTSSDNWATLVNQAKSAFDPERVTVNDWLRANYAALGLTNIIDMCAVVESSLDSGLFNASAGGGTSQLPHITIGALGAVTACTISTGVRYPVSSAIPLEVFYPEGTPGAGLALTANTDGAGNITSVTVNAGGVGHLTANPPLVGVPGQFTNDGVHPSGYGHFSMIKAGLFRPSQFVLPAPSPVAVPRRGPFGILTRVPLHPN